MSRQSDLATVRRVFAEIASQGHLHIVDEIYAPDYIDHNPFPGAPAGREGVKYSIASLRTVFPDLLVTTEEMSSHADQVAVHAVWHGTHLGEVLGVRPTGKRVSLTGTVVFGLRAGLIAERWAIGLDSSLFKALGLSLPWLGSRVRSGPVPATMALVGTRNIELGRISRWRDLNERLRNGMAADFAASRRRHEITRETRWPLVTSAGARETVLIEAVDPLRSVTSIRTSRHPFDRWLNDELAAIHGGDPWTWVGEAAAPAFAWNDIRTPGKMNG